MAKKLSFYCTLSGQLESNGYDYSEEPESVSNDFLVDNAWKISQQLKKEQSDVDMAEYLPEELGGKIASVVWSVDELHGNLVGKIDCTVTGELTEAEIECLKEWIIGQNSDGLGEGFEQRPIHTDEGDLYVSLWQWDNENELMSEEEMEAFLTNGNIGMGGM